MDGLSILLGDNRPDLIKQETLADLFSQTVARYPDKIALIFNDESLTYSQLDKWSNAIALMLISKGLNKQSYIGVWWHRGLELHAIILGIVKADAVYVPVDREIPAERVEVILKEVGASGYFSKQPINVECGILNLDSIPDNLKRENIEVDFTRTQIDEPSSEFAWQYR